MRSLLAAMALCLSILGLRAQRDMTGTNVGLASIQGQVFLQDAPNQTLEQVPVQLSRSNGVPVGVAYTSGNGQFLFNNLPTGGYEVSVAAPGYHKFSQTVSINTASGRVYVQVHLRRLESRSQAEPGGPPVDVRIPPAARREYEKGLERLGKQDSAAGERHSQAPEVHLVLFHILRLRQDKARSAAELRTYLKEMDDSGVPAATPAIARARELLAKLEKEIAAAK